MELKLNQVILFRNKNKKEGSKQPDYIGSINIEGQLRDIAMWAKKAQKSGATYLLGTNAPPYQKPEQENKPQQSHEYKQQKSGKDDPLPF